jgi:hypothetical protein
VIEVSVASFAAAAFWISPKPFAACTTRRAIPATAAVTAMKPNRIARRRCNLRAFVSSVMTVARLCPGGRFSLRDLGGDCSAVWPGSTSSSGE